LGHFSDGITPTFPENHSASEPHLISGSVSASSWPTLRQKNKATATIIQRSQR